MTLVKCLQPHRISHSSSFLTSNYHPTSYTATTNFATPLSDRTTNTLITRIKQDAGQVKFVVAVSVNSRVIEAAELVDNGKQMRQMRQENFAGSSDSCDG